MKQGPAITLWQPWASLLFVGHPGRRKVHETRSFPVPSKHMGRRVAIHAAKRPIDVDVFSDLHAHCREIFGTEYRSILPRGAVIGTVIIDQWVATEFCGPDNEIDRVAGDWSGGRFAWRCRSPRLLSEPLPLRGRQGWFSVPLLEEDADAR